MNDRLARDVDARASGILVNTCSWTDSDGYALLLHTIDALSIDVVLVMAQDKLYSNLVSALGGNKAVTVVKLPKSGGVVTKVRNAFRWCVLLSYYPCRI